jgi:protein TonB
MKTRILLVIAASLLASCASHPDQESSQPGSSIPAVASPASASQSSTLTGYKREAAQHISQTSVSKTFTGRPQALLRSVVVVKYVLDAQGNLTRSEIMRSNRDSATEAIALATLRSAAPFPKPASSLLRHGRVELMETWLFNNDGRFQLRTIAEPQMDE